MTERRGLLALAAEGIIPVLGGCAGALVGGAEAGVVGGMAGVAVGQVVEKVINVFGVRIVARWAGWLKSQPAAVQQEALSELASLTPEEARRQAKELLDELPLEVASPSDKAVAIDYLSLLPGAMDRALPRDLATGGRSMPPTVSLDEPAALLAMLPVNLPPYPVGGEVPGTVYRLEALLGSGGFGAVYRASARSLQHLPLAIKFCLDPGLSASLHRERGNLERLMKAGRENWSPRVVRLYGYDLEHPTPYLVYEYVTGGDLARHVAERQAALGRPLNHQEVFELVVQAAEALGFAHAHGLVHRDLKPANILVEAGVLKLADFGLGGVTAARSAQVSRIGATTVDMLSVADQASLFRGAGTPLYMAPEQRRGQPPDPRHDLYSLGVMWYQLLVGDVTRELHPGWAKELTLRHGVPRRDIDLIERCVGWYDERPASAGELLALMRVAASSEAPPAPPPAPPTLTPKAAETARPAAAPTAVPLPADATREELLGTLVKQVDKAHEAYDEQVKNFWTFLWVPAVAALIPFVLIVGPGKGHWAAGVAVGLLLGGAVGAALYFIRLGWQGEARDEVLRSIQLLNGEFPEIVRSWGGEGALRNRDTFQRVTARYRSPDAAPALPTLRQRDVPHLDPEQREKASELLRRVYDGNRAAEKLARRRPLPLVLALLIGLALGIGAGVGVGFLVWESRSPLYLSKFTDGRLVSHFYDHSGRELQQGQYRIAQRWPGVGAGAAGVGTGLVVFLVVAVALARGRWQRGALIGGALLGAAIGAAVGAPLGVAYYSLFRPDITSKYVSGRTITQYTDASGRELPEHLYLLEGRRVNATAGLLGVASGALVFLAVVLLMQRWSYRRALRAQQELPATIEQAQSAFPEVVAAAGGPEALRRRDRVYEIIEAINA